MGEGTTPVMVEPALQRFADRLWRDIRAERVLLFGSRARGSPRADSDYDVIVVSPHFAGVDRWHRGLGLRRLWREEGGHGPMDLICLTPSEFAHAQKRITLVASVLSEAIDLLPVPGSAA